MSGYWSRLAAFRYKIVTYFYSAIGLAALTTILMIAVTWYSFERITVSQRDIYTSSMPAMVSVVRISKLSSDLVAAVPKLLSANSTEEVNMLSEQTGKIRIELEQQLSLFQSFEQAVEAAEFSSLALELDDDIRSIETSMQQLFELRNKLADYRNRLQAAEIELRRTIIPLTDNQLFYLMTGRTEIGIPAVSKDIHFTVQEVNTYRHISAIARQSNSAFQFLAGIGVITDVAFVQVRSELFESTIDTMRRSIDSIDDEDIRGKIEPLFERLMILGMGEENGFVLKEQELRLLGLQTELIEKSRDLSNKLASDAEQLVTTVQSQATSSVEATVQLIGTSRTVLISLGIIGIIGAATIVWLLIGRSLIPRLQYLSQRMRSMGSGNLDNPVEVVGKDEIAEMASALEIFRKSALDARRLNIVEELSKDLQAKNSELQSVLDQLQSAQSQIVMREKLAALGELTAGVAHEIKNPLNFVTNFSDASKELIEELNEITEDKEIDEEERKEEIESICKLLADNVGRIKDHGSRAVRIVNDMLRMGRGGGQAQETDINQLVEQHAKLAFHGARASTEDFQIKLVFNLDPETGSIEIVSQDIGRVILNIVGNSCYATHKKRMKAKEEAGEGVAISYVPQLTVSTQKKEGEIFIKIHDNGFGIPDELIEKIFNPFFTTKPTDEGTGLGLALCNDIVQKHGGEISVNSENGEFTEMTIKIPENTGKILADAEQKDSDV